MQQPGGPPAEGDPELSADDKGTWRRAGGKLSAGNLCVLLFGFKGLTVWPQLASDLQSSCLYPVSAQTAGMYAPELHITPDMGGYIWTRVWILFSLPSPVFSSTFLG